MTRKPEQFNEEHRLITIIHTMSQIQDQLFTNIRDLEICLKVTNMRIDDFERLIEQKDDEKNMTSEKIQEIFEKSLEDSEEEKVNSKEVLSSQSSHSPSEKSKRMFKKETLDTIFHDSSEKSKKKRGRPRKVPSESIFKEVYNPDKDPIIDGFYIEEDDDDE